MSGKEEEAMSGKEEGKDLNDEVLRQKTFCWTKKLQKLQKKAPKKLQNLPETSKAPKKLQKEVDLEVEVNRMIDRIG